MNKTKLKKSIILTALLCVVAILISYIAFTAADICNYGKIDEKQPADAAIILGAGTSDGEVSPVYKERINHGIWLYSNNYVKYIILTGGVGDGNTVSDAFTAKQYALSQGVPESAILIEEKSTITEENLEFSKQIMNDCSLKTAIIVSDPLHMKRAMLMAKDYKIDAYSSPTPTTRYETAKTKLPFLARELFFYTGYRIVRLFK